MKKINIDVDFIVKAIMAGQEVRLLAVGSLLNNDIAANSEGIQRGNIYTASLWAEKEHTYLSFYNINDSKIKPLTIGLTSVRSNPAVKKKEDERIQRMFIWIDDMDEMITSVICDPSMKVPDKAARLSNCISEIKELHGEHYVGIETRSILKNQLIFDARIRHLPMLAKKFNVLVLIRGMKRHALNWKINVEVSECSCDETFNCCDCGGNECGCSYCFSCNACEKCLAE